MCIQIIHDQDYLFYIRIHNINKVLDFFSPVFSGSMFSNAGMMFAT